MNNISQEIERLTSRTRLDVALDEVRSVAPPPAPDCPNCNDLGVYSLGVPFGDDRFGKLYPCECDAGKRHRAAIWNNRIKGAGVPPMYKHYTLSSWEAAVGDEWKGKVQAFAIARQFINNAEYNHYVSIQQVYAECGRPYKRDEDFVVNSIIFQGDYGVGKTGLAIAIVNTLMQSEMPAMYIRTLDFINAVQSSYGQADNDREDIIQAAKYADMLCLDEFNVDGAQRSDDKKTIMEEVIRYRYMHEKPTIITCNADRDGLTAQWGKRTVDALLGMAHYVRMGGFDMRRKSPEVDEVF